MSETAKNTQTKANSTAQVAEQHKISLVELILILLLVGLVFVFFFGMRQLRVDKAAEALAYEKFEQVKPVLKAAIDAAEAYKRSDDFGDYPFDFGQLNLTDTDTYTIKSDANGMMYIDATDFAIHYDAESYNFTLTSTESFGKAGVKVIYVLADRSYQVEDPSPERRPTVRDEWLPQD
jgi:hypothetical protein